MNRKTPGRISLAAVTALLLAGCAAGPRGAQLQGMNAGSTTGDVDACSAALGNGLGSGRDALGTNTGVTEVGGTGATANGLIIGNVALVALPVGDAASGTGAGGGGVGLVQRFAPVRTPDETGEADEALERVRTACDRVVEIRVVNSADDRRRLAEITAAMRQGRPVTAFMPDLNRMMQAATPARGAEPRQQGVVPGPSLVR